MRSLSVRLLLSLFVLALAPAAFAHDITITGTQSFASLDGSSSDHDGVANGVFSVSDGNLVVNGVVNCNDDGVSPNACAMAFAVSGNMTINSGGALYAENRSGSGTGAPITMTVGGNLALNGTAIVSSASKSSSGSVGGAITANVSGSVTLASGTTIDSGAANATGGSITIAAGGAVSVNGNALSGPSRTILSTRLTDAALDGGTGNTVGGAITIGTSSFAGPALSVGATANIISQGGDGGAGPVKLDGCGIEIRGLVAALGKKDGAAQVSIRSGKNVLVDGRDLGGSGTRMGRLRGDAITGTGVNKGVDVFAAETIDILGPSGSLFVITSHPGVHDSKSYGGLIRVLSLGAGVNASGNVIDSGRTASGDTGGTVQVSAKNDVNLNTAVIRAVGDSSTNNPNRGGGSISVRSYSGNVVWTNGTGDVRPVGSSSGLAPADQGSITLTACGTVNTTGSSFPSNGVPTSPLPATTTGACSPGAPSLPSGVPALITCNTPPVANDTSATTNEDTTVTITLSGSDADGDSLTFSIVSGPSNGSLGAIIPTGPTTATVDYTPNLNYFGGDSFVFRADDGNGGTDDATVTITVAPVNDPPTFQVGATVTVLEDSGPQTIPNWVTAISPGPANEAGQTVTFTVTTSNPALFSVQPMVSSTGTLTFTPAPNMSGGAALSVTAQDNGGTANGGNDTSAPQPSSINVTAVNDEPSFVKGADQTVNEDAGPQTVSPWATAISAGPNESGQTLTFVTSNDKNELFSVQPSVASDGTLTYTPAADANGTATVSVYLTDDGGVANGGDDTSPTQTFTITVNAVNDPPSFTGGADVTVDEDSGLYNQPWATAISAGPANESGQTLTFNIVSNSNPSLFASGPSVSSGGALTFTPAANAFGSATIVLNLQDNGGGSDTSANDTLVITVNPVNDEPSFTGSGDVTVDEDSGPYMAAWATAISPGPNESGQTVNFVVTNTNNSLFSAQPAISPTGILTFTPAPNANGSVTVSVTLHDNGGTANGGDDTSGTVTFTLNINAVNDAPAAANDTWETLGNTEIRVDLAGGTTPKIADTTPSGNGVRDNDSDPEGDPFVVTGIVGCSDVSAPFDCTLGDGAKVSMLANGSFSFTPGPGTVFGMFQYQVTDVPSAATPQTSTGTVNITIYDRIWYVNGSAAPGGNGTSIAPFNSFASLNGGSDVDTVGDTIFIHNSLVSGSLAAEGNQKIWGEGVGLSTNQNLNGNGSPQVLVAPGMKPQVSSSADTITVTGVTGVDIAGLSLSSTTGSGVEVSSSVGFPAAGATIRENVITFAGGAGIDVNADSALGTTALVSNTSITSVGNGFDVNGSGPSVVAYNGGTIASASGNGIWLDGSGSGGNLTVTGLSNVTIDGTTAAEGIHADAVEFDAIAGGSFNTVSGGTIVVGSVGNPVGGAGVSLTSVSGDWAIGSLTVFGGTTGVTVGGSGLFTGAAGMRITNGGGSISAPAGVGLSITNATIGAAGVTFTSITSTGTVNGIVLNNTGSSGGLTVLGTGSAGSGGSITNATGDSIVLVSTKSVSLSSMNVTNSGQSHIDATNVDGLSLISTNFDNSADHGILGNTVRNLVINGGLYDRGGAAAVVANKHGVFITNLLGNSSVSGATFRRSNTIQFRVSNTAATTPAPGAPDVLTVSNTTWDQHTGPFSGDHLSVDSGTGGNFRLVTNGTGGNNTFTTGGIAVQATGSGSGKLDLSATGLSVTGNSTAGVVVGSTGTATVTFNIFGNKTANGTGISNTGSLGVSIVNVGSGAMSGTFDDNTITNTPGASAMQVILEGNGSLTAAITNNVISGNILNNGIRGQARLGTGLLALTISNNDVSSTNGAALDAISLESGASGSGHANTICLNMLNNTASTASGAAGYRLRQRAGTTFNLQNFSGSGTSTTDISNWINVTKSNVGTTSILIGSSFSAAPGPCATP